MEYREGGEGEKVPKAQLKFGFTQVANDLLEALIKALVNGTQFRIIMLVLRKSYGFHRKECSVSESYIAARLGIKRQNVHRELKVLLGRKILSEVRPATFTSPRILAIDQDYGTWLIGLEVPELNTGIECDSSSVIENGSSTGIESDSHLNKPVKKQLTPIAPKGATDEPNDKQQGDTVEATHEAGGEKPANCSTVSASQKRFEKFWQAYPKKVGKGAAERSFKKYKPDDGLLMTMLKALECQRQTSQWQRHGGQYIPNPATWLNQRRWQDEIPEDTSEGGLPYLD